MSFFDEPGEHEFETCKSCHGEYPSSELNAKGECEDCSGDEQSFFESDNDWHPPSRGNPAKEGSEAAKKDDEFNRLKNLNVDNATNHSDYNLDEIDADDNGDYPGDEALRRFAWQQPPKTPKKNDLDEDSFFDTKEDNYEDFENLDDNDDDEDAEKHEHGKKASFFEDKKITPHFSFDKHMDATLIKENKAIKHDIKETQSRRLANKYRDLPQNKTTYKNK